MRLTNLSPGQTAKVTNLTATGKDRRRLLDLGLIPETIITVKRKSPLGDPTAYLIRGAILALRKEETDYVKVKKGGEKIGADS